MKRLKTGKTDPHSQECTVLMYHCKMWILSGVGIQVNDGMYIAPEKELKSGNKKYLFKKIPS
jgi:hypothetical protein